MDRVSMDLANSDCNGERSRNSSIEAVDGSGSESNSEFLGLVRWRPLGPSIVGLASSTWMYTWFLKTSSGVGSSGVERVVLLS